MNIEMNASRSVSLLRLGLLVILLMTGISILAAAPAEPETYYQLSGDGPLPIGGRVNDYQLTSDGAYAVYLAGQEIAEYPQLHTVPTNGSAPPLQLTSVPNYGSIYYYAISPDNLTVVYAADQDTRDVIELYAVPLDGSAPPVKLSDEMVEGGSLPDFGFGFQIAPDGSRVVYRADQDTDEVTELYSVPLDGSDIVAKLNDPLPDGGGAYSYAISADSQYVVYNANQDDAGVVELFVAPIDGSADAVKLSGPLAFNGGVSDFKISPDSATVVYRAEGDTAEVTELYAVPIDDSADPIKLNGPLAPEGDVGFGSSYYISPDSQRVVYLADQETNDVDELYSAPITGGSWVKLNPPLVPGGDVSWIWNAQISPDSSWVVYVADQEADEVYELFSVPIAGGTATKLNGPMAGNYLYDFAITPDGSSVVYRAQRDTATIYELYSVPLAGGSATELNGTLAADETVGGFLISPDSGHVVYQTYTQGVSTSEIYRVPLAGGSASKINGPLTDGGAVQQYAITADNNRVIYLADQEIRYLPELYRAPLPSPGPVTKLNPTLAIGGDIWNFQLTNDSRYAFYLADHDRLNRNDLYRVRIDGSDDPLQLTALVAYDFSVDDVNVTEDSNWVVFTVSVSGMADTLYSAPVSGSPLIKLNATAVPNARLHYFRLSDDSKYVVYRAEEDTAGVWEIYSARVDGSGLQVKLNETLPTGGEVDTFQIVPGSERVIYTADQDVDDVVEIYSVPIGGGAATKLNSPLTADGDVQGGGFDASPDGAWLAYLADQDTDEQTELYLAPTAGGAPPVKLNGDLTAEGDVGWFQFSPNSDYLIYYADQDVDEKYELYGVSLTAPYTAVKLNDPLPGDGDIYYFEFSPDGAWLAYVAYRQSANQFKLYTISMPDGEPIELDQAAGPDVWMDGFLFSPDSSFLLYSIYPGTGEGGALYRAPADGSAAPQVVTPPAAIDRVVNYWLTASGDRIIYQADQATPGIYDVYSIASDGSGAPVKLNGPLGPNRDISSLNLSADDNRIIYMADQDIDDVFELYAATIPDLPPPPPPGWRLYLPVGLR